MNTVTPSMLEPKHMRVFNRTGGGSFAHRVEAASTLLRHKNHRTLVSLVWEALFGAADMVLVRLELDSFHSERLRRYALTARPAEPRDATDFFDLSGLTDQERRDAASRLFMLHAGIQTCYVVENNSGRACFLQWLIPFSENEKLHRVYGKWYPDLRPGEALVEHAYMLPQYRGCGMLPCAAAKIVEIAREAGVRSILAMIPTWNTNSLRSFMRLGFTPYECRSDRKFLGVHRQQTHPYTLVADARLTGRSPLNSPDPPNRSFAVDIFSEIA